MFSFPTRPTRQFVLNVVTTVPHAGASRTALDELLIAIEYETAAAMRGMPVAAPIIDFATCVTLHYARLVLLEVDDVPPRLSFTVYCDGPVGQAGGWKAAARAVFAALLSSSRSGFDRLYATAADYPAASATAETVIDWLLAHAVHPAAFFCGSRGRSRVQILDEAALRLRTRGIVDDLIASHALPAQPHAVREVILARLGDIPPPFPAQRGTWHLWLGLGLALVALVAVLLLPALVSWWLVLTLVVAFGGGLLVAKRHLNHLEATDEHFTPINNASEHDHVRHSAQDEDRFFQNPLSNVVLVRAGRFRRIVLRSVLFSIDWLARTVFVHGQLGGIASIHFAHWYLLDEDRHLVFFSNFDSSWESYLGDFIDQASSGLTAVWSNTCGYPRTTNLVFAGAEAGERFKAWARHIQIPTRVWYSAYPHLSIREINDNTLIRRGLADAQAVPPAVWLARLS